MTTVAITTSREPSVHRGMGPIRYDSVSAPMGLKVPPTHFGRRTHFAHDEINKKHLARICRSSNAYLRSTRFRVAFGRLSFYSTGAGVAGTVSSFLSSIIHSETRPAIFLHGRHEGPPLSSCGGRSSVKVLSAGGVKKLVVPPQHDIYHP